MARKKASKKAGGGREPLVVASKAKDFMRGRDCNVAGDALEGLNEVVYWYLAQATERCHKNRRKTVQAHDFIVPTPG